MTEFYGAEAAYVLMPEDETSLPQLAPPSGIPWQFMLMSRYCVIACLLRYHTTEGQLLEFEEEYAPYVCPGCYAVGGEPCAPGCIDDELARDREYWRNSDRDEDEDLE